MAPLKIVELIAPTPTELRAAIAARPAILVVHVKKGERATRRR